MLLLPCYNICVEKHNQSGLQFRCATRSDSARLLSLLAEMRVPIAGSANPVAHRALVNSICDSRLIVLLAEDNSQLCGVCLGVIHPSQFWKSLALRNPLVLLYRGLALVKRRLKRGQVGAATADPDSNTPSDLFDPPTGRKWGESAPSIAQIALVLLRPEVRGSGQSARFFARLLSELEQRGVRRIDARIGRGNIPSIRMCRSLGLKIEDTGANVFMTGDLPVQESDG